MEEDTRSRKPLFCPYCSKGPYIGRPDNLIRHIRTSHKELDAVAVMRASAQGRLPSIDIDKVIQRYVDRLECLISLNKKTIHIKHYLMALGIRRHWRDDNLIMRTARMENIQTKAELDDFTRREVTDVSKAQTPEQYLENMVKTHRTILKNKGAPEAVGDVKEILMRIKFMTKKRNQTLLPSPDEAKKDTPKDTPKE